jgi:hypothetical protein
MRNVDELERRLVHGRLEILVAAPVAIGLLDDEAALEQQPLDDRLNVEGRVLGLADAKGDVLEVAEQGHILDGVLLGHFIPYFVWSVRSYPSRIDGYSLM